MGIDLRTLILILGITHLMQVLVFAYQYKANKNLNGPGWWLMWSAAEVLSFAFILMRDIPVLLPYVILFQSLIMISGTLFIYVGVQRFFDKQVNLKFIIFFLFCFLIVHLFFIFINDNITIRSFNISVFLAIISFVTAISILKNKTSNINLTANFNSALFILHGIMFSYRAVMIIMGTPVTNVFVPSFFNFLPYLDALIVSLLWTFGFIMMVNQRLNFEILESKAHFELIFNTSPDAVIISRLNDGMVVDCNEGFIRSTGYSKSEVIANSTLSFNFWKNQSDRLEMVNIINSQGFCENIESQFQQKDGKVFTGLISAKIILLKGFPYIISVIRNINDRKQAEEEIKLKNEELKKLNSEKDKFFSIIAHDLRLPFNGFLGLTNVLVENLPEISTSQIQEIALGLRNSATNLFRLLENLLEWSRIKQGLVQLKPEFIPLLPVLDESISILREAARIKGIEISYDVPGSIQIYADSNALQTIIRNLVSNAIKYSTNGGKITLTANSNEFKTVEIAIKDTGIGMNRKIVENLFNLDVKTNRKGTNGELSTGLGLILCKDLIEKSGGKIWVESEEGKGSVFYFIIPSNT